MISQVQSTATFNQVDTQHWTITLNGVNVTSGLLLHTNIYGASTQATLSISDSNGGTSGNGAWSSVWLTHWYDQDCHQLWQCLSPVAGNVTVTVTSTVVVKTASAGTGPYAELSMWEFANLGLPSSSPLTSPSGPTTTSGVTAPAPSPSLPFTANTTNGSATLTTINFVKRAPIGFTITGTGIPANTTIVSVDPVASTLVMSHNATATGTAVSIQATPTLTAISPTVTPANVGDLVFMFAWGGQHWQYESDVLTNVNQATPPFTNGNVLEPGAGGNPITPPWTNVSMGNWGGGDNNQNPLPDSFAWQVVSSTTPVFCHWTMFTTDGWFSQGISFAQNNPTASTAGILPIL